MPKDKIQLNKKIRQLMPKSRTQRAVFESAGVVATTSQSGSQSTQSTSNSAAVSAAAKQLNDIIGCIDCDDVFQYDEEIIDYIGKIEQYRNHRLPDGLKPFNLSKDHWNRVAQAAKYAKAVHQPLDYISFIHTSRDTSTRGFGLYRDKLKEENMLVIAFCATRSLMEWMANANAATMVCEELGSGFEVHKGLGSIAKKTQHLLVTELNNVMVESTEKFSILFTGHSSGGAIAQLLFGFMNSGSTVLSRLKADGRISSIHCVTFGTPPISNPPISHPPSSTSMFISFSNEGDPVPLAEPDYVSILVQAWARPAPSDDDDWYWRTPTPLFFPSGVQVALRSEIIDEEFPTQRTSAFYLDTETRSSVLFGEPLTHSMANAYLPRIQELHRNAPTSPNPFEDPPHEPEIDE